ncbi:DUF5803 family protein [Halalkalicoccus sp. NIPERK01]|uniref:DUF5803 family protein n=1 Tax=Halalkalicoccus sp. NIPERK01 TaxID=3053469 RepID=UPI00256F4EEF|nr:DUF5803 family protein [Halalkalicoccus sp. NIPERK01]MDL5360355.1 DUF5803 family protein [Halalkalicoccus sp. NIPERK01]
MNRRLLAIGSLVALVFVAGCAGFGSTTSEEGLNEEASYDWDTEADATIEVTDGEYRAVYTVENRSTIRLYESTRYGDDNPIDVRAVQFRYPDGTVVGMDEIEVEESRSGVTVHLPAENGQLAFTSDSRSRNFATETFVEGSYEVILPPGYRVDNFVLANVRPGGYEAEVVDDQVHIRWDEMNASAISVRYYLERDVYLFGGLILVASIGAAIAGAYVYRQMQELRRKREEAGLDVDIEEDDRKPPPGMR